MKTLQAWVVLAISLASLAMPIAQAAPIGGTEIHTIGLKARLVPEERDSGLQKIARYLHTLDREEVLELQGDFQHALLLHCDAEVYDTLSSDTIAAIDTGLEALFDLKDIDRDNDWEPLVYIYGFFNRNVTPDTVRDVIAVWDALSDKEKKPRYPTYIHVIDAVTKPLSMGALKDPDATRAAMEIVLPALKETFLAPPKPGTAFHPPSHACLVLGPLYDRWIDDPKLGTLVKKHLGTRAEFEAMMTSQLVGALDAEVPLSHKTYGYHAYIGSYLANALARLDARPAVPALRRSMDIYIERKARGRVLKYTHRALLALGDEEARDSFATALLDSTKRDENIETAAWLARNGQGETREFGLNSLSKLLSCTPEEALDAYFKRSVGALAK